MNKGIRYVRTVMLLVLMLVLGAAFSGGKAEAASKYMIKINKQQNVVTVYKMKGGKYKAYKAFVCSAGYATPTGTFRLGEKMRWHTLDGPSYGQYCSRIVNGILYGITSQTRQLSLMSSTTVWERQRPMAVCA